MCNLRNFIIRESDHAEMAIATQLLEVLVKSYASHGLQCPVSTQCLHSSTDPRLFLTGTSLLEVVFEIDKLF